MLRARAATDPGSPTTLVFGVTTEADLFCMDELAELTRAMAGLEVRTTVARPSPAWSGRSGFVTEHLLPAEPAAAYYLCGPPPMVSAVHDLLFEQGVPSSQIHAERFLESGGET
jgi:NAD(P)H-flavin reductase